MAKWFMILGVALLVVGALLQYAPWAVNWFGKLPGDIRIQTGQGKIFIPITSMVIISIVLTVLVNLFRR
ncbi:DUF2905 domain-containing protein [Sulfuriflexus mobilis]|uniref:DUF2905 domain-containing protein n=1 Tax=Sulfuriflexus mobilis TaxID=1811807 RepID=UPI000F837227|nr:DUF2905 domain-containing protein [Sulfuriflexus mobilis]